MPDPQQAWRKAETIGDDPMGESKWKQGAMPAGPDDLRLMSSLVKNRSELFKLLMNRLESGVDLKSIPREILQAATGHIQDVFHGTRNKNYPFSTPLRPTEAENPIKEFSGFDVNRGPDFDFGIHVDKDPKVANSAISVNNHYSTGGRILPLKARMDHTIDMPDMGMWKDPYDALRKIPVDDYKLGKAGGNWEEIKKVGIPPEPALQDLRHEALRLTSKYPSFPSSNQGNAIRNMNKATEEWPEIFQEVMKRNGVDSVRYLNKIEGEGAPSHMLLDGAQLRMPWANFDPRKILSKDLLAGAAGAAVAAPALMSSHAQEEEQ